jgi:hypothetical protein
MTFYQNDKIMVPLLAVAVTLLSIIVAPLVGPHESQVVRLGGADNNTPWWMMTIVFGLLAVFAAVLFIPLVIRRLHAKRNTILSHARYLLTVALGVLLSTAPLFWGSVVPDNSAAFSTTLTVLENGVNKSSRAREILTTSWRGRSSERFFTTGNSLDNFAEGSEIEIRMARNRMGQLSVLSIRSPNLGTSSSPDLNVHPVEAMIR